MAHNLARWTARIGLGERTVITKTLRRRVFALVGRIARSGDRSAFGALIEGHQAMARRVARGIVGHEETARELANEAMLQAYLSLDQLRDASRFQSWLYGIVLNVCRGHIREQQRAPLSLEEVTGGLRFEAIPFTGIEPDPHEVAESQELHRLVLGAVDALSPKNRAATLLFYYDQLSVREVAATLGVSVAAVKTRLHSSRARLRELLLPAYADLERPAPREKKEDKTMVKVEIVDVIAQKREDKETGASWTLHAAVLLDEEGRRVLPIWMGQAEGRAIAIGLKDLELPRPMTFAFMADLLDASGVQVEEVRVERLKDDTYYAVAKVRNGEVVSEIDARPSDGMALALHAGSPIYAADDVLQKAAMDIPAEVKDLRERTMGIDSILEQYYHATKPLHPEGAERIEPEDPKKRQKIIEKQYQELMATLFGSEGEGPDEKTCTE